MASMPCGNLSTLRQDGELVLLLGGPMINLENFKPDDSKPDDPFCKCGHEKSLHTGQSGLSASACRVSITTELSSVCTCQEFDPAPRRGQTHSSQTAM